MKYQILILIVLTMIFISCAEEHFEPIQLNPEPIMRAENKSEEYNPKIDPADFSTKVTNEYFTLVPGTKYIYEGQTEDGLERTEVYVTNETKTVMGVETMVVRDTVWLKGEMIEDTYDWFAQDKEGNVWYFGEDSREMVDGKISSYAGSWEAGIDGALPGILMEANPQVGDSYRQEYLEGVAEDQASVIALGETAVVPYYSFRNCLITSEWNPLEVGGEENKYYCKEIKFLALEVSIEDSEITQLINITKDEVRQKEESEPEELATEITEEDAIVIALQQVPGEVTDVAIEKKFGKVAYVVEIDADYGPETDVIIDIDTGEVLGIET